MLLKKLMVGILLVAMIGCKEREVEISGKVALKGKSPESFNSLEINLIDETLADRLFAERTDFTEKLPWPMQIHVLNFLRENERSETTGQISSIAVRNILNAPNDSEVGEVGRRFIEITATRAENAKRNFANVNKQLNGCYEVLHKATLKSIRPDSSGHFSFVISGTNSMILFARFDIEMNSEKEELSWLIPIEQNIVLSEANLLSKFDAFKKE